MASVYDFSVKDIHGKERKLDQYKDKVMLIVNVASECGFTPQYKGLEAMYEKLRSRGLEVLGFPCNQFGAQEPGAEAEIKNFCETKFSVQFPLFAKIEVNGPQAHPLYKFLREARPGISVSASDSSLRPKSARPMSLTMYSLATGIAVLPTGLGFLGRGCL